MPNFYLEGAHIEGICKEYELNDFQVQLICRKPERNLIVTGPKQTGKTTCALYKAKQITERGYSCLFLVQGSHLIDDLSEVCNQFGLQIRINTPHGFLNEASKCDKDRAESNNSNYDFIIIDDVEKMDSRFLPEIRKHCRFLLVFGDFGHNIYSVYDSSKITLINLETLLPDAARDSLVISYMTKETGAFLSDLTHDTPDRCIAHGCIPILYESGNLESQCQAAALVIANDPLTNTGIFVFSESQKTATEEFFIKLWPPIAESLDEKTKEELRTVHSIPVITAKSNLISHFNTVFILGLDRQKINNSILISAAACTRNKLYVLYDRELPEGISFPSGSYYTDIFATQTRYGHSLGQTSISSRDDTEDLPF